MGVKVRPLNTNHTDTKNSKLTEILQRNRAFESFLWTDRATKGLSIIPQKYNMLASTKKKRSRGYCNDCYWLIYVKHNEADVSIWECSFIKFK